MLDVLHALEKDMPRLVRDPNAWRCVCILFKPSFKIDRLVADWSHGGKEYRVRLHQFHPYERREDAVIHHHEWPMAARILKGSYELQLGWSSGLEPLEPPPAHTTCVLRAPDSYEMVHEDMWHSVRPLEPCWTLMVFGEGPSGSHWPQKRQKPPCTGFEQYHMPAPKRFSILQRYEGFFPLPDQDSAPVV